MDLGRMACALAAAAAAAITAAPAAAQTHTTTSPVSGPDTRHALRSDRSDQPRNPDGSYSASDIYVVQADYSPAGILDLRMSFYGAIPASSPYTASWVISAGTCEDATTPGARVAVTVPVGDPAPVAAAVAGYIAPIAATSTVSPDRHDITVRLSDPTLVNRDFRCVNSATSTAGPGGTSVFADTLPRFFFVHYTPLPLPAPALQQPAPQTSSGGAVQPARLPTLSLARARSATRHALVRRYGRTFTRGAGYRRDCRRQARLVVRCRVAWRTRTTRYRGTVTVASAGTTASTTRIAVHRMRRHRA
jgi:hypothetical protein